MASILITGATGFIGRRLTHVLRQAGHELTLMVSAEPKPPFTGARVVVASRLEKADNLDYALEGVDTVVHLAGLAHIRASADQEAAFKAANALATQRLVQAVERRSISRFIHMSSLAAITPNASMAVINDYTDDPAPTPYGSSKREAETYVRAFAASGAFAVSLRPPLVIGSEARGNWALLQRLASTGLPLPFAGVKNRRSFIGVDTLTSMIAHLCGQAWGVEKSGDYCVADREEVSLAQVICELRKGMNMTPRLFSFPVAVLAGAARAVGRGQMAAGLLGDLRVDAGRFNDVFSFAQKTPLVATIQASGRDYIASARKTVKSE